MKVGDLVARHRPLLALAPMQDVTDRAFWELMARYGGADVYYTEYFRVHADSRLDRDILTSITGNPTGHPVVAQMIGNDIPQLVRTARELAQHDVIAIDLNLGCPAPVVYRKCAGGGLLRDLPRVRAILQALREAVAIGFTVKTRLGFDDPRTFDDLLPILAESGADLVTVHGRTVAGMYRAPVDYNAIAQAAAALPCPVLANGNIDSPAGALRVMAETGVAGLMLGRGAIRNPWLFEQVRAAWAGRSWTPPTGRAVFAYLEDLFRSVRRPGSPEKLHVQKMKKYLNFIGVGIDPAGEFLHGMRRAETAEEFFALSHRFLDHDEPMTLEVLTRELPAHDVMAAGPEVG